MAKKIGTVIGFLLATGVITLATMLLTNYTFDSNFTFLQTLSGLLLLRILRTVATIGLKTS